MKHTILALETVNALITEPSIAHGIEGFPDIVVLALKSPGLDWGAALDSLVDGCMVLGFKKIVLDLKETEISSSFLIACIASAWQRLIEIGGTLAICGLSESAYKRLQELIEPGLFNIFDNLDSCIDWADSVFGLELNNKFPRAVKCVECGTVGQVVKRGEHLCTECGVTYLVTERGELLF